MAASGQTPLGIPPGPELKDTNPTEAGLLCQELPPSQSELNDLSGHTGSKRKSEHPEETTAH